MNNQNQICQTCYQRIDGSKVEPGEGYRLLTVGERRKPDDEFFVMGRGWRPMRPVNVCEPLKNNSAPTRRKIPVSSHDHATDSGQRARPVCSGEAVGGHVVAQPKVYPGFGYRLLEIGETIRASDEALVDGYWKSFTDEGKVFDGVKFFFPRRRKIEVPPAETVDNPGEGFRFLEPGETISPSDEFHSPFGGGWITTSFEGRQIHVINKHLYRRKIETAVEPGEGFRLLAPNEILEVGDEFFAEVAKAWEKFYPHTAGMPLCPGATARRRIPPARPDPGAGYRLLAVGEVRQKGDEYLTRGKWEGPTADVGHPVFNHSWPYRRKISPKQYRLMAVGEMTNSTDEVWDDPSGDRPGVWRKLNWRFSVVRDTDPPVRREIDNYIGGPA